MFKYSVYIALILASIGGVYWKLQSWHYTPLKECTKIILTKENNLTVCRVDKETLKAEKQKLIMDMSIVYDNGYKTGFKEGYKYEKKNTTTVHSIRFPF